MMSFNFTKSPISVPGFEKERTGDGDSILGIAGE